MSKPRKNTPNKKPPVITGPHKDGGWMNMREGADRASKRFDRKADAVAAGRKTATRDKTEHKIKNRDNKFSDPSSYGNDPRHRPG